MLTIPMCKITVQHLIFKEVVGMVCEGGDIALNSGCG